MNAPANRLAAEKSPYLLQHAHNPVDWYPWGSEAFAKARREDKPIFLSVGYSTCHWCHVMAHESFENADTARIMNEHFVCVKLDREERPDVDRVYMTFVQATTGSGGWPMSVWLTPELEPFLGGTYFPPEDRYGRRGFPAVLNAIADAWKQDRAQIVEQGARVVAALREQAASTPDSTATAERTSADIVAGIDSLWTSFDRDWGGFGGAPKFPRPALLRFLARAAVRRDVSADDRHRAASMWLTTLRRMAMGGMHDHLGGGFHRYSVDAHWHVPHFEKMLYDQAQLALSYLEAIQFQPEPMFTSVVRDLLEYVRRDLTSPEGGFYCAEDADSLIEEGKAAHAEGAFYVWSEAEVEAALTPEEASAFCRHYSFRADGNAAPASDPQGEFTGKNILLEHCPASQIASEVDLPIARVLELLASARAKLFVLRNRRPRPHLDDKILVAWNGLMISAFARAATVLGDPAYLAQAERAAEFLRTRLYNSATTDLFRVYREGPGAIRGFADDYAFLIAGLLDLHEASGDERHLEWAEKLQARQDELFTEPGRPGYFNSEADDASVLVRMKEDHDGAEPAVTSVSVLNLIRLAAFTGKQAYRDEARRHAAGTVDSPARFVHSMPLMFAAQESLTREPATVVIAGPAADPQTIALRRAAAAVFLPDAILLLADGAAAQAGLARRHPHLEHVGPLDGKPAAFVCRGFTCLPPVTEPDRLAAVMNPE